MKFFKTSLGNVISWAQLLGLYKVSVTRFIKVYIKMQQL